MDHQQIGSLAFEAHGAGVEVDEMQFVGLA